MLLSLLLEKWVSLYGINEGAEERRCPTYQLLGHDT
jgi:hypothetical protein